MPKGRAEARPYTGAILLLQRDIIPQQAQALRQ